jgi:hypothetical protein
MLRSEIDYTIKSTIDHYKGEIFRLNSENEKLRLNSHIIGNPVRVGGHGRALPPRQIIVRLKDSNVKKRILKCRKNLKDKPE